jgi:hypothetical protein
MKPGLSEHTDKLGRYVEAARLLSDEDYSSNE